MKKSHLFNVPPGVLNEINPSLITKRIDDSTLQDDDYTSHSRSWVEEAFSENVLEGQGPWKGVVMRIDIKPVPRVQAEGSQHHLSPQAKSNHKKSLPQGKSPTLVHLKCRIPFLHAHLPIPRTGNTADPKYPDHYIIDQYPTYTAMSDGMLMAKVKVGDVVILDYADRKNFTGPIYVSPITAQKNTMVVNVTLGGFGNIPCAPAGLGNQGGAITGGGTVAPHQGKLNGRLRPRNAMNKAVMFGDSQMVGTLGNYLKKYVQSLGYTVVGTAMDTSADKLRSKPRVSRSGSGVHNWLMAKPSNPPGPLGAYWQYLESALKAANPGLVVACLGGNDAMSPGRAGKYADLVNKIKSVAPNCHVLFFGPPPATLKKDGSTSVKDKLGPRRSKMAAKIGSSLSGIANLTYIDPHKYMPVYMKTPSKRDGIHVDAAGARELINNISNQPSTPVRAQKAQVKPTPKRSNNPTEQEADASKSETGVQWKNPDLLAAARSSVSSVMSTFSDSGSADAWLSQKANSLKGHMGMSAEDALAAIKNRDFISGFLVSSGRSNINSGKWMPLRVKELELLMNQTIKVPGKIRIAGTKEGSQYGPTLFDISIKANTTQEGRQAGIQAAGQANANVQRIRQQIREQSQKFTAAQLVSINEAPLPAPMGTLPAAPCVPVGSMGAATGVVPGVNPADLPKGAKRTYLPIIEDAIYKAAQLTKPSNIDLNSWHQWMRAMCWIESKGTINAINRFGYTGLFQFGRRTWNATRKFGLKKGVPDIGEFVKSLDMALNPYNNSLAGGLLMASNIRGFGSMPVNGHHIYMAHQQGLGGAKSIYRKANANQGWNTQNLVKGDFKRAWVNWCSRKKTAHGRLKAAYQQGKITDPWNHCKPVDFYNEWGRKFNRAIRSVSKDLASPKGGISKNSTYISRMESSILNPGMTGDAAIAKPKSWGVA